MVYKPGGQERQMSDTTYKKIEVQWLNLPVRQAGEALCRFGGSIRNR
jgi:hypothetical protein